MSQQRPVASLRTEITHVGQKFIDQPVYETMRPRALANAVRQAVGHAQLPVHRHLTGYQRTPITWVKPGDARLKEDA